MEQTINIINTFYERKGIMGQLSAEELRDIVDLSTGVLNGTEYTKEVKKKAFVVIGKVIMVNTLSIRERWALYYMLIRMSFVSTIHDEEKDILYYLYQQIFMDVEKEMPENLLRETEKEGTGPVVVVTNQFLMERHAPTRRVLDYSFVIQEKLGIPVVIMNAGGMNIKFEEYMHVTDAFNFLEELSVKKKLTYNGVKFDFYQTSASMPDIQEVANLVWNIRQLNPRAIISVGGSNLVADLCRNFTKTIAMDCSTDLPRSMSDYLVLARKLREEDKEKITFLTERQVIIPSTFNYIVPRNAEVSGCNRSQYNIPESAWVLASVGNRMEEELDDEFLQMIDETLEMLPEAHYLVVGPVLDPAKTVSGLKNAERIHFSGAVVNGCETVGLADVYIQPTRKGGGRAAFEALYNGVPVLVTPYGDAWNVCGEEFEVASYEEMKNRILEFFYDSDLYLTFKRSALERAKVLEDMESMLRAVLANAKVDLTSCKVNDKLFYPIFGSEYEQKFQERMSEMEQRLHRMEWLEQIIERRTRTMDWANVFRDTVVGSEWFHDVSLSPGRVALDYPGLYAIYRALDEFRPKNILELGLGQSTRVIGKYSEHYNVNHTIVEHDLNWINFFLDKHGKGENTEVLHLERKEEVYHGKWLDSTTPIKHYEGFAEQLKDKKFDFIFVDGPQGSEEISRVDITELLPECLNDSFVIFVDDSQRPGETRTVQYLLAILKKNGIAVKYSEYDGIKNTAIIVSEDLAFLCSL